MAYLIIVPSSPYAPGTFSKIRDLLDSLRSTAEIENFLELAIVRSRGMKMETGRQRREGEEVLVILSALCAGVSVSTVRARFVSDLLFLTPR
jgi:hypothetical protein